MGVEDSRLVKPSHERDLLCVVVDEEAQVTSVDSGSGAVEEGDAGETVRGMPTCMPVVSSPSRPSLQLSAVLVLGGKHFVTHTWAGLTRKTSLARALIIGCSLSFFRA